MRRTLSCSLVAALGAATLASASGIAVVANARPAHAALGARSDFNCDGFSDLAVGVPSETVGGSNIGIVQVFFGSSAGLQPNAITLRIGAMGALGSPASGDAFGAVVRSGEYDGDSCSDLAVGAPGVNAMGLADSGAVFVFFGSATGFDATRTQRIERGVDGIAGASQARSGFGSTLANGDANGDFVDELAIGSPNDDLPGAVDGGSVTVVYGRSHDWQPQRSEVWRQGANGVIGGAKRSDHFGAALAFGNFAVHDVSDFSQELAIGVPGKDLTGIRATGAVVVLSADESGLSGSGSQQLSQNTPGVPEANEAGDGFGASLASGPLIGNDVYDDLAIAMPNEDVGRAKDAGAVVVLGGSVNGLVRSGAPRSPLFVQGYRGTPDRPESGDRFGTALAVSNASPGTRNSDLVIGVPFEDVGRAADAGGVAVIRSLHGSLTRSGPGWFVQGSGGVPGASERGDLFGLRMASGDYRGIGANDLAIGAPYEDAGRRVNSGIVTVIGTDGARLSSRFVSFVGQDQPGTPDASEPGDRFGFL